MPSDFDEEKFFLLRKEGKTYISKVFTFGSHNTEKMRNVQMVMDGSDHLIVGEVEGSLCLRMTGEIRRTQVTALVSQDDKKVRRVTLQTFKNRADGSYATFEKDSFTFRGDELIRLNQFLTSIGFVDLSNRERFQIEDISQLDGPKAIIDASDSSLLTHIKKLSGSDRERLLDALASELSKDEVNIILGRKKAYAEMLSHIQRGDWAEKEWQDFFEREKWIFGYGLDYRIMRPFDREMVVGGASTDNREKPTTDFLMTFTDYTVLVELKRPDTPIFQDRKGGRAGTWRFSSDFMDAVSQVLEQKAQWLAFSQAVDHYDKAGAQKLEARTRNTKTILVIGSKAQFQGKENERDKTVMRDTFELFRQETRGIEILTFDELLERTKFILDE